MTTRTKMNIFALGRARKFIQNNQCHYIYVPANKPVIVGFTDTGEQTSLKALNVDTFPQPSIGINRVHAPGGMQWLTVTLLPLASVACKWTTPAGEVEPLIIKAALRTDLLPGDLKFLERLVAVLHVMAGTGEPSQIVGRVVSEVGRAHAIEGIRLARWLREQLGNDEKRLAAWLTDHHPVNGAAKGEAGTRGLITGSGYEDREWYDLERILRGAHRFVHPTQDRRPPRKRR